MSADDIELHFSIDSFTSKQREEFESLKDLMGFLQVALIGIGKASDHLMLYEAFSHPPWPKRLKRLAGFFEDMGIETIPEERNFHASVPDLRLHENTFLTCHQKYFATKNFFSSFNSLSASKVSSNGILSSQ